MMPSAISRSARSARLRMLSLGVPSLSRRSALSLNRAARSKTAACSSAYLAIASAARSRREASSPPLHRRSRSRSNTRPADARKERNLKAGKPLSPITHMINRRALLVAVILSATMLLSGCGLFNDPREQANEAISRANESIAEHNRLFEQARSTYADVKEKVESGDDPSAEKERIAKARADLEEARKNLRDARESVDSVRDLDVEQPVKRYASLLSEAMGTQLEAEAGEIKFYSILEKDPALENRRKEALDLLTKVGNGYEKAENAYARAQEFADSKPGVIEVPPPEKRENPPKEPSKEKAGRGG